MAEPALADIRPGIDRLSGSDRARTAIDVSATVFEDDSGGYVLATGAGFPDALAGGVLAAQLGGPVLLTPPGYLPDEVLAELNRVVDGPAFIVGGPAAVNESVADEVSAERISGANRYETAAAIARQVLEAGGSNDLVYLTTGTGFADAVSVSGLAASQGAPILLADEGHVEEAAGFVLDHGIREVVAVGGKAVVDEDVLAQVAGAAQTDRLAGSNRYGTSHAVAEETMAAGADSGTVWLATGADYPDALAAGAAVAEAGGVLHLAAPDSIDTDRQGNADARGLLMASCPVDSIVVVGGPAALSPRMYDQAKKAGMVCDEPGAGPTPEPTGPAGTRSDPIPLGQTGALSNGEWTIEVTAPARDITAEVLAENQFNDPPAAGNAFLGAPVTVTFRGEEANLFELSFDYITPAGNSLDYEDSCGVVPGELDTFADVFDGGTETGYLCFETPEDQVDGSLLRVQDFLGNDQVFLALQ